MSLDQEIDFKETEYSDRLDEALKLHAEKTLKDEQERQETLKRSAQQMGVVVSYLITTTGIAIAFLKNLTADGHLVIIFALISLFILLLSLFCSLQCASASYLIAVRMGTQNYAKKIIRQEDYYKSNQKAFLQDYIQDCIGIREKLNCNNAKRRLWLTVAYYLLVSGMSIVLLVVVMLISSVIFGGGNMNLVNAQEVKKPPQNQPSTVQVIVNNDPYENLVMIKEEKSLPTDKK